LRLGGVLQDVGSSGTTQRVSETLFRSLKVERLHGERLLTLRQAKDAVSTWLLWYNGKRMHSTLNYVSPAQYEQQWNQAQPGRGSDGNRLRRFHTSTSTTTTGI
jgi:putative transposase